MVPTLRNVAIARRSLLASAAENSSHTQDPLQGLRQSMMNALRQTALDAQTRRVFEVATHKGEYVTEMQAVRDRHLRVRNACMAMTRTALTEAARRAELALPVDMATAALGLHVMVDGLIQN